MDIRGINSRFYENKSQNIGKNKKKQEKGFEYELQKKYEEKKCGSEKETLTKNRTVLKPGDLSGYEGMGGLAAKNKVAESILSEAVSSCDVKNLTAEASDYIEKHIGEGYVLKAKQSDDKNEVYIEQKFEDGTVKAYTVLLDKVEGNTKNPIETAALICKNNIEDKAEDGDIKWKQALEEFTAYVKDRIKNGPPKFAAGATQMSEEEWNNLVKNLDETIDDVKKEQAQELQKRLEKEKQKETVVRTPFDKFDGQKHAPYWELADESGVISYNGVTFVCDDKHGALCLGDVSDESKVLTIPLAGGGTLKVNRDNKADLAMAIGMFKPEDMRRILEALAQDNKIQEMKNEIEDEKSSIGEENITK